MNPTEFVITRFKNRNGVVSWRVSGWLAGTRIRKNVKTRAEAAAEKAALDIKAEQVEAGLRPVMTTLTDAQLGEAEAAFRRLAGQGHSLLFCVDYSIANYRPPETQKQLADAIAEYVAAKQHELDQDQLSIPMVKRVSRDLRRLERHFPKATVAELTVPALIAFLEKESCSLKTYNNRRGIISTFFKFAFQRGWVAENLIAKVPHHRIRRRRGMAKTLTAEQARDMMHYLENFEGGRWVPYFALCLFAGIRPAVPYGEITKLQPDAINLETGVISVSAAVSKVREPRKVEISPNLTAWLRAYPLGDHPIEIKNFYQRRAELGKKFGLMSLDEESGSPGPMSAAFARVISRGILRRAKCACCLPRCRP